MASSSATLIGAPAMADSRVVVSLEARPLPPLRSVDAQKRRLMGGVDAGERVDESMRRVMFFNCWGLG